MDTNVSLGTAPQQTLPRCGIPIQSHSNVHMALLFPFNRAQVSEPIFCPLHLNWHWDSQTLFGEKQPVHRNGGGALCSMSCSAKKLPLCRKAHIGSKRKCSWLRGEAGGVIAVNLNSLAVYPSIQFTLFFFFFTCLTQFWYASGDAVISIFPLSLKNLGRENPFNGLPWWLSGKESAYQCSGFNPWVGKIPWRRKWQPIPVSLPGKSRTEEPGRVHTVHIRVTKESDMT